MAMILGGGLLVVLGIANALVLWRAQRWFYDWQVGQMARFGNWIWRRVLSVDPPVGMNPFGGFHRAQSIFTFRWIISGAAILIGCVLVVQSVSSIQ